MTFTVQKLFNWMTLLVLLNFIYFTNQAEQIRSLSLPTQTLSLSVPMTTWTPEQSQFLNDDISSFYPQQNYQGLLDDSDFIKINKILSNDLSWTTQEIEQQLKLATETRNRTFHNNDPVFQKVIIENLSVPFPMSLTQIKVFLELTQPRDFLWNESEKNSYSFQNFSKFNGKRYKLSTVLTDHQGNNKPLPWHFKPNAANRQKGPNDHWETFQQKKNQGKEIAQIRITRSCKPLVQSQRTRMASACAQAQTNSNNKALFFFPSPIQKAVNKCKSNKVSTQNLICLFNAVFSYPQNKNNTVRGQMVLWAYLQHKMNLSPYSDIYGHGIGELGHTQKELDTLAMYSIVRSKEKVSELKIKKNFLQFTKDYFHDKSFFALNEVHTGTFDSLQTPQTLVFDGKIRSNFLEPFLTTVISPPEEQLHFESTDEEVKKVSQQMINSFLELDKGYESYALSNSFLQQFFTAVDVGRKLAAPILTSQSPILQRPVREIYRYYTGWFMAKVSDLNWLPIKRQIKECQAKKQESKLYRLGLRVTNIMQQFPFALSFSLQYFDKFIDKQTTTLYNLYCEYSMDRLIHELGATPEGYYYEYDYQNAANYQPLYSLVQGQKQMDSLVKEMEKQLSDTGLSSEDKATVELLTGFMKETSTLMSSHKQLEFFSKYPFIELAFYNDSALMSSPEEDFAKAFALFVYFPKALKEYSLARYCFIEEHLLNQKISNECRGFFNKHAAKVKKIRNIQDMQK